MKPRSYYVLAGAALAGAVWLAVKFPKEALLPSTSPQRPGWSPIGAFTLAMFCIGGLLLVVGVLVHASSSRRKK
jgi:hypothetical protein